jgi:hypothetical protein
VVGHCVAVGLIGGAGAGFALADRNLKILEILSAEAKGKEEEDEGFHVKLLTSAEACAAN